MSGPTLSYPLPLIPDHSDERTDICVTIQYPDLLPPLQVTSGGGEGIPGQPYRYARTGIFEPDWTRLPGWRGVTPQEWESAQWQRAHCVKTIRQLRDVYGSLLPDEFYADLEKDQARWATMSMLLPPQMLNTIVPDRVPDLAGVLADPVRRYMVPLDSDRVGEWPSHPYATRDSLHEQEMWLVEGLTQRYPTKVLAEIVPTCPQYCGHCTRMDLVGNSTPQVQKLKLETETSPPPGRHHRASRTQSRHSRHRRVGR